MRSGWLLVMPAVVILAVVLCQVQWLSFWRDGGAILAAVHRSLPQMLRMLGYQDAVHGACCLLMWFWVRVSGGGEMALRFLSAVAMAAAFMTVIGRWLVPPGAAAGLVFVALPSVSRYGQVARPYALVAALAAVAGYLLVRALAAGPGRRGRWLAGYGAALAGLGLANVFGLLLIPAHLPLLLLSLRRAGRVDGPGGPGPAGEARKLLWGWLAAVVAACVVVSPVVVLAWAQRHEEVWVKPVSLKEVTGLAGGVRPALVAGVIVVCVVVAGAARGRARLRAGWPAPLLALAVPWLLLPAVLLLAGSLLHPSCCLPVCGVLHRGGGAAGGDRAGGAGPLAGRGGADPHCAGRAAGPAACPRGAGHSENLRQLSHLPGPACPAR